MRESYDKLLQLLALLAVTAWVAVLVASRFPLAVHVYFALAALLTLLWLGDALWHALAAWRRGIREVAKRIESPIFYAAVVLVVAGLLLVSPQAQTLLASASPPPEHVAAIEVQLLPHVAVLYAVMLSLLAATAVRRKLSR